MDSLVFKKFDFKKCAILDKLEEDILATQNNYNAKGVLHSSMFVNAVFKLIAQSAEDTIDALLETYDEVGKVTGEEIIITKENEIRQEIEKLASDEGQRSNERMNEINKRIGIGAPREASFFGTNLLTRARDKTDILIETTKRQVNNSKPRKTISDEVFVIMPIGNPLLDKIWTNVYVSVIQDFKLGPKRIDKHNEGRFLMSEVADLINRSKLIIADLTNERPNCYLEVGYALGLEKYNHLILCARENHNHDSPNYQKNGPKVHFDITGYDILFWDENKMDDFKLELAKKIKYRLTIIEK